MSKKIEFKYGDLEQILEYKPGQEMEFNFPMGAIFFVGNNQGMVFCNKIHAFKEKAPDKEFTKFALYNNDNAVGYFFFDLDKNIQIILSSDDTVFKPIFIYNVF
ncbi:hypothetical protein BD780_002820 [Clostridium tetanomorphum]|uniref:Uncharacterized protein n=1 Tax=Clostridium tetanomorphum TaxID=1553 RepID=A0A923J048_CLOTT|nr:hypothetical protein [Clostridium tetanomorphum]KAJ53830.1 hypothetical protein CTM_01135 [Clostridium tetanomorphum DSM 665]MBC2397344.1 hypothetical protein [Clostridium tetanomorphum]MBP1862564.1 hypothetical protein [Clostridium tetanomorphum]NRS85595.1 hypothetical protein [Clostridium tetanomorphum]NRZ96394.1 hypothetical protein [Clostridium tetanomorphum]